jgi:hypothetical protein
MRCCARFGVPDNLFAGVYPNAVVQRATAYFVAYLRAGPGESLGDGAEPAFGQLKGTTIDQYVSHVVSISSGVIMWMMRLPISARLVLRPLFSVLPIWTNSLRRNATHARYPSVLLLWSPPSASPSLSTARATLPPNTDSTLRSLQASLCALVPANTYLMPVRPLSIMFSSVIPATVDVAERYLVQGRSHRSSTGPTPLPPFAVYSSFMVFFIYTLLLRVNPSYPGALRLFLSLS